MILFDVNVLIYAHRQDADEHKRHEEFLLKVISGDEPFAVPDIVLSGFLRIVTHPRIFSATTPIEVALSFVDDIRSADNFLSINPGRRHWEIFTSLCRKAGARGNLIPDAYLAAICIESGCELVTTDREFSRFPGLKWHHPFK